jgi:transcriptional regulator GlxA family with amidase domain
MDLTLSLVTADFGADVALAVARELVMYMHRPGNQAQFSAPLDAQTRSTRGLASLVDWMLAHLREDLSVERLAQKAGMSERNFRRVFSETFAQSPARYVAQLRLERACTLLSTGRSPVEAIARSCGFAHPDVFRRAFVARYGTSPREYRERFRAR